MAPADPSLCSCDSEWRNPKPSGICASCGGWVHPHDHPKWDQWVARGLTEDEMRAEMRST